MYRNPGQTTRFLIILDDPVIKTRDDLPEMKHDPGLGKKGIRDSDHPCEAFDPGGLSFESDCDTDGHYVCSECKRMSIPAKESLSERSSRQGWVRHHDTHIFRQGTFVAAVQGNPREWTALLLQNSGKSFHHFKSEEEAFAFAEASSRSSR
jgi:hypothetical protein